MLLLISCFIAAMLFLLAVAEADNDDEMADERESRMWIRALADESMRRRPRARGRYNVTGCQMKGGARP